MSRIAKSELHAVQNKINPLVMPKQDGTRFLSVMFTTAISGLSSVHWFLKGEIVWALQIDQLSMYLC